MKKIPLLLLLVSSMFYAQIVDIPDPLFKQKLLNQTNPIINTNGDDEIQLSEAEAPTATVISVHISQFTDLTGIEAFINLERIWGQNFAFTVLDVSNNNNLKEIFLTIGDLEQIIPPTQTGNLEEIVVWGNNLEDLSFINNYTNLKIVTVSSNEGLNELNVSNLTALEELGVSNTGISDLNLGNNLNLESLSVSDNNMTTVDITPHNLISLSFGENIQDIALSSQPQLESLTVTGLGMPTLDLSSNTGLIRCNLSDYPLPNIDLSGNVNLQEMNIRSGDLTSLDLSNNSLLYYLNISSTLLLENIDLTANSQLEILHLTGMQSLQSLNVSNNTELTEVELIGTLFIGQANDVLDTLDFSQNILLESLELSFFDGLNNLITDGASSLNALYLYNLSLETLDFNVNPTLRSLLIKDTSMLTVNISALSNLEYFSLRNMPTTTVQYPTTNNIRGVTFDGVIFEELDFSGFDSLCWLRLSNGLNLEKVDMTNVDLVTMANNSSCITDPIWIFGTISADLVVNGNPNLSFICVDDAAYAANNLSDRVDAFVTFTEDCSLSGANLNNIEGSLSFDLNANNCGAGATALPNRLVISESDGFTLGTVTDEQGAYQINVGEGNYTTSCPNFTSIFDVVPNEVINNFVGFGQTANEDFCVQAVQSVNDFNIAITSNNQPILDGIASYSLVYENAGTVSQNGEVTLTFEDDNLNLSSADPTPTSQSTNTLTWDLGVINPLVTGDIAVSFVVFGDPVNEEGDSLSFTATIEPISGDVSPDDNTFTLTNVIEAAPFTRLVNGSQADQVLIDEADEYVYFSVGFDNPTNIGIDNAVVYFSASSFTNIDWTTVQVMATSHLPNIQLVNNTFYVYLDNVNLPPTFQSGTGGSQGYVTFRFKPVDDIVVNESVSFNPNISLDGFLLQSFATVTYVAELAVPTIENDNFTISLYPNPTDGIFTVQGTELITEIKVFSILGQEVYSESMDNENVTVDISSQPIGTYFVKVATLSSNKVFQIIKK